MGRQARFFRRFTVDGPTVVIACLATLAIVPALDRLIVGEGSVVPFTITVLSLIVLTPKLSEPRFSPHGPLLGAAIAAGVVLLSAISIVYFRF